MSPLMSSQDVLYDVAEKDLTDLGFRQYFNKPASVGNIKNDIQPPSNSRYLFVGCGKISSTTFDLGIIISPNELFVQQQYTYCDNDHARNTAKRFFTYYDTDHNEPIGFAMSKDIRLCSPDCYDCGSGTWKISAGSLDKHRLSAYTTSELISL